MNLRKVSLFFIPALLSSPAFAAVDTAGAITAIGDSVTSAQGVGTAVIAGVAGLVVVGLIIAVVKKL